MTQKKCTGKCLIVGKDIVKDGTCQGCGRTINQIINAGKQSQGDK